MKDMFKMHAFKQQMALNACILDWKCTGMHKKMHFILQCLKMHAVNQQMVLKCMNGWVTRLFRQIISYKSMGDNYDEVTTQLYWDCIIC